MTDNSPLTSPSEQEKKLVVDQVFRDLVKETVVSDKFKLIDL